MKIVAPGMGDEGMPEAPHDRTVLAEKSVNGLVHSSVFLRNRYVAPCSVRIGQHEFGLSYSNMYMSFILLRLMTKS